MRIREPALWLEDKSGGGEKIGDPRNKPIGKNPRITTMQLIFTTLRCPDATSYVCLSPRSWMWPSNSLLSPINCSLTPKTCGQLHWRVSFSTLKIFTLLLLQSKYIYCNYGLSQTVQALSYDTYALDLALKSNLRQIITWKVCKCL